MYWLGMSLKQQNQIFSFIKRNMFWQGNNQLTIYIHVAKGKYTALILGFARGELHARLITC